MKQDATEDDEPSWFDLRRIFMLPIRSYGELGPILEIQELPMQFLAVCKVNDKEILFPLHEEIIIEMTTTRKYSNRPPDGLLDVYLND